MFNPIKKMASVLVPCCAQLEFTKLCVPSLLQHSREPFELIFIDVGSLDGTADYLSGFAMGAPVPVKFFRAFLSQDLPEALKEAFQQAEGEYLVFLNNDTIVTEAWLDHLVTLVNQSKEIGMVGPMSNNAPSAQLVEGVPYRMNLRKSPGFNQPETEEKISFDLAEMNSFAREWREKHKGRWAEVMELGGFCLLFKREILEKVAMATSNGLGLFETQKLILKARQAGYKLACARDLFIHHFGTRNFSQGGPGF